MRKNILHELKMGLMAAGIGAALFASFLFFGMRVKAAPAGNELSSIPRHEIADMMRREEYVEPVLEYSYEPEVVDYSPVDYSASDLDLLAAIVYAEAGDQDQIGQRLVADVVLNRVASPAWPNTIAEVIYQPGQFSPVTDGGLDRAWGNVTESCYEAARLALAGERLNTEIIYFSMYGCQNGTFVFQYGCHYFGV